MKIFHRPPASALPPSMLNVECSMFFFHSALRTTRLSDSTELVEGSPNSPHSALFANSSDSAELVSFTNDLALGPDGWAQLAPFGDFPGRALLRQPDGSVKTFDAIQRLDRAAAEGMTAKFKSLGQRLKRFLTGCHIYVGHPDVPAFANDYPDKNPKGMIVDLSVRDDGLYCKPVFTNEGSELIESKTYRAFSGYWSAQQVGEENGKTIFRPDLLKSAGLTNRPNLPVHLMNEGRASVPTGPDISVPGSTRVPRVAVGVPPTASPAHDNHARLTISNHATNVPPSPGGEGRGEGVHPTDISVHGEGARNPNFDPDRGSTSPIEPPTHPVLRTLLPWLAWHG